MQKCPYCAQEIQDDAIVCKYCQREIRKLIRPISTNWKEAFKLGLIYAILVCASTIFYYLFNISSGPERFGTIVTILTYGFIITLVFSTLLAALGIWLWMKYFLSKGTNWKTSLLIGIIISVVLVFFGLGSTPLQLLSGGPVMVVLCAPPVTIITALLIWSRR